MFEVSKGFGFKGTLGLNIIIEVLNEAVFEEGKYLFVLCGRKMLIQFYYKIMTKWYL